MGGEVEGELRRMVGGLVVMSLGGDGLGDEGIILNSKARGHQSRSPEALGANRARRIRVMLRKDGHGNPVSPVNSLIPGSN